MAKKNEIARIILKGILISGGIAIAATNPRFLTRILPRIFRHAAYKLEKRRRLKNFQRSFYYLRSAGMIKVEKRRGQIFVSLTEEGKKTAGRHNFDELKIKKTKKWDKKWRILIFDIPEKHKIKREALRGKLKELGLYKLQDSVWICPYEFKKEMDFLKKFFYLNGEEMKAIITSDIEDDSVARTFFRIS